MFPHIADIWCWHSPCPVRLLRDQSPPLTNACRGLIQLISLSFKVVALFIPNGVDNLIKDWGKPGHTGAGLAHWPTDLTRGILPIPCHSHNDYWRDVPLYSAIQAGCIGVEADIWRFSEELYVGHSISSLTPNRTLNSLYIEPLLDILSQMNTKPLIAEDPDPKLHGVFDTEPSQSLIFLIDFKTYGPATWPALYSALAPLRKKGYLTHVKNETLIQRPITIVGTGNTPFSHVISTTHNPHRDVFFDAPLEAFYLGPNNGTTPPSLRSRSLDVTSTEPQIQPESSESTPSDPSAYTHLNTFYASTSFKNNIGSLFRGEFSDAQLQLVRGHIRGAHARGLKSRYWETPFWPIGLRNHVWDVLVTEGEDILNVDDLKGATKRDWGRFRGWWRHGMRVH